MSIYDSNCDYNKYKIFYAVAEYNSFSKAVDVLHISQPAISYAVKELEYQLNTKLFIRENRKIKLTDDGEKLMYYLRRAFNDINIAEKIIKENKKEFSGTVRVGIYQHISLIMLPNLFSKFKAKYKNVKYEVLTSSSSELKEKLKNRELDFIIAQYPVLMEKNSIFIEEKLFELKNCFFATEYYYKRYKNKELDEIPMILPFRGYVDIDTLDKLLATSKTKIVNDYRIYTFELTRNLVEKNLGIGWGPRKCIEKELNNKKLFEMFKNLDTPNTKFSITYNDKSLNETSKEFIRFMKEEIKELDESHD